MKSKIISSLLLIVAVLTMISCTKNEGKGSELSIEITEPQVSGNTAIFTIIPSLNATSYGYAITPEGQSESIKSEEFSDGNPREITVTDLEMASIYTITATVSDGSESATETMVFSTATSPSNRHNLFVKFTGSWCSNCPAMTTQLERLQQEMGEKLIVVAMHGNDGDLTLDKEMSIIQPEFGIVGYPTGLIDYYTTVTGTFSQMKAAILKSDKNLPCVTDITLDASISGNEIKVSTEFKIEETGKYKYCTVVTEDNISRPGTVGSKDGLYHHVARAFATNVMGDPLNGETGDMQAGETKTIENTIPISNSWNRNNLNVVVYILKQGLDGKYQVNNARTVEL